MAEDESGSSGAESVGDLKQRTEPAAGPTPEQDVPDSEREGVPPTGPVERAVTAETRTRVTVPRWIQLVGLPLLVLLLWGIALAAGPVLLIFAVAGVLA